MIWPYVFDGIGALVVSSALDPEQLVDKIDRHSGTGALSWIAPKVTGLDTGGDSEVKHAINVWRGLGLHVGGWIYNIEPKADVASLDPWRDLLDFVIYDVERPYKEDETPGGYAKAAELVARTPANGSVAVTSYGAIPGYGNQPSTIDFGSFARAGWPIFAQLYDGYTHPVEETYALDSGQKFPGPYPREGLHQLVRSLTLQPGMAVYRPEGIDG